MLNLVTRSPGKIDALFKFFAYTGLAVAYGVSVSQMVREKL